MEMMAVHTCEERKPLPTGLGMRGDSHAISKFRSANPKISPPSIRIIHIFAPEVIKTDVANFRELVQRLTGKPIGKPAKRNKKARRLTETCSSNVGGSKPAESFEFRPCLVNSGQVKEAEGGDSASFFSGLGEFDSFMGEIGGFPLLPFSSNSHMDVFGDT